MKNKTQFLYFLFLILSISAEAQQLQQTFQNKNYINIDNHWRVLSTSNLNYYQIIDNQITVKFVNGTSDIIINNFIQSHNLTFIRKAITGWYDFQVNQNTDIFQRATNMISENIVSKLEIPTYGNYEQVPNDTLQGSQWALDRIQAKDAWNIETGNPSVIIAVIDSGIDWTHEDLGMGTDGYENIYLNSGEDAWSNSNDSTTGNGIDDDGNGLIDDWKGWNFPLGNNDSRPISNPHGTRIAGIIGAKTNNNKGIAGIGGGWNNEGIKILPISIGETYPSSIVLDDAIIYAAQSGAKIIQLSVQILTNSAPINDAINYVYDNYGVLIVCSSGNNSNGDISGQIPPTFPSNHPKVIAIGNSTINDLRWNTSNYGEGLFMVAPGTNIATTLNFNNYTNVATGTSYSAPMVSATIGLMWSINPCLAQQEIIDILAATADKVGGYNYNYNPDFPGKSFEFGNGRLNTYQAVLEAQTRYRGLDLVIKDSSLDTGEEPNTTSQYFWASEDIWIRNSQDGIIDHQNPEYSPTVPNYIYVRVKNNGCQATTGIENLSTYWAKASTSLNWPQLWNGATYNGTSTILGNPIGTVTIPILQPGQETILSMPFIVPNPSNYNGIFAEPWHFCLLARIVSQSDEMTFPETQDLVQNVINNNNIAWKNVTIVDYVSDDLPRQTIGGVIAVGNTFNTPKSFYLELVKEDLETGKPVYEEAEVTLKMDEVLYQAWVRGGKISERVDMTLDEKVLLIKGNNVLLKDLEFNANEIGTLYLKFNFLTQEITEKAKYVYHVIQKETGTNKIIGGETYIIKKKARPIFIANPGGDINVDRGEIITIYAEQINEAATYNWYDIEGNLVFQGTDLTVDADIAQKYKLEVIALSDGYKDYAEVEVKIKPSYLSTITPNPATNTIAVGYKLNEVTSAYLMIIGYYGNASTSNNYILDLDSTNKNIDISYYQNGFYTVALVCNGQILDAKTFVKQ